MRGLRTVLAAASFSLSALAAGVWELDGDLRDTSGAGHEARAAKREFVALAKGQGLGPGIRVEVADAPDLRLQPGLEAECRFRLDERPAGPQILFTKDREYLLRVEIGRAHV